MPFDQDEDTSPPKPFTVQRKPLSPASSPQSVTSTSLGAGVGPSWGKCGVIHEVCELIAWPGEVGVVRYVNDGVSLVKPPASDWRPVPSEPGRYEMPWNGDPTKAKTLEYLRQQLAGVGRKGAEEKTDSDLMRSLDSALLGLVELTRNLHQQKWTLGLICPQNVVLKKSAEGVVPILADLGFRWQGSFGPHPWEDCPGRPEWLDHDNAWSWLWESPPIRQQFADPNNGVCPNGKPVDDIRTLGRLFAWVLTGRSDRELFAIGGSVKSPPCWEVLRDSVAGQIDNVDDFAARLSNSPPSTFFAKTESATILPPPKPWPKRWYLWLTLLVLAAIGISVVVIHYQPDDPETLPIKDSSDFEKMIAGIQECIQSSDFLGASRRIGKIASKTLSVEQQSSLDEKRTQLLIKCVSEKDEAMKLAGIPVKRNEAAFKFRSIYDALKSLEVTPFSDPAQRAKEKECLTVAEYYAKVLGSLP